MKSLKKYLNEGFFKNVGEPALFKLVDEMKNAVLGKNGWDDMFMHSINICQMYYKKLLDKLPVDTDFKITWDEWSQPSIMRDEFKQGKYPSYIIYRHNESKPWKIYDGSLPIFCKDNFYASYTIVRILEKYYAKWEGKLRDKFINSVKLELL